MMFTFGILTYMNTLFESVKPKRVSIRLKVNNKLTKVNYNYTKS